MKKNLSQYCFAAGALILSVGVSQAYGDEQVIHALDWGCDLASKVEFCDLARGIVPEDKMAKYLNRLLGGGKRRAIHPATKTTSAGGIVKIAGNAALPAALVMQVGMGIWEVEAIETRFAQGELDEAGRRHAHAFNIAKTSAEAGVILAGAAVTALLTPAGPLLIVTVGGTVAAAYAAEWAAGKIAGWYNEWQDRLAAENFRLDKERLAAVGVFDVTPETIKTTGLAGAALQAYAEAYDTAMKSGKFAPCALISVERKFDDELFMLEMEADFYAKLLD